MRQKMLREQQKFFQSGVTRQVAFRLAALAILQKAIKRWEAEIIQALKKDLGKSEFESYETEIGLIYEEIRFARRHLRGWTRIKRVKTPLVQFPSRSYIRKEPLGNVLIIAPWNYPFQLTVSPLIGAIAAGNTAVVKPSELSPATAEVIEKMIAETFEPHYIHVVLGGIRTTQSLLEQKFDHIFFTGSTRVGALIAQKAAQTLTPVTLELGGKSPCIVDETADIPLAARRIAWGKFLNAGQTCVAPDYIICQEKVQKTLTDALKKVIDEFWPGDATENEDYPKIINTQHFERLVRLMESGNILIGGKADESKRKISPTVLVDVSKDSSVMQEEIFGPILPVLTYRKLDEIPQIINNAPLSFYLFSTSKENEEYLLNNIPFGGGCVNDTIVHLSTPYLPFGGVGQSGTGSYHGKKSFDCFSHEKSILKKGNWLDIRLRYPPYARKLKMLKRFLH